MRREPSIAFSAFEMARVNSQHGTFRGALLEAGTATTYPLWATKRSPFRYFKTSTEIIRLAVMIYVRLPLSLLNVEDLLHERGIDISHKAVRFWWNRFGPMFAAEIRRRRVYRMRFGTHWQWHLDEVFVKINGERTIFGGP
jgi:transposase-like protein